VQVTLWWGHSLRTFWLLSFPCDSALCVGAALHMGAYRHLPMSASWLCGATPSSCVLQYSYWLIDRLWGTVPARCVGMWWCQNPLLSPCITQQLG
jgi:hypothetical protein